MLLMLPASCTRRRGQGPSAACSACQETSSHQCAILLLLLLLLVLVPLLLVLVLMLVLVLVLHNSRYLRRPQVRRL
jgi:hypothetical protein